MDTELCNGISLADLKQKALKFLFNTCGGGGDLSGNVKMIATEEEVFLHFLIGSCDAHHMVIRVAEGIRFDQD